jgi:hypothetical protein
MGSRRISKRWIILAAILVVVGLVAGGGVLWSRQPKKLAVKLEVTGTRGLPFQGTAEVDGVSQDLNGTVPAEFTVEGSLVVYSFTSTAKSGGFQVRALLGERAVGSAGSGNPPIRGVRGWVKSDQTEDLRERHMFENFSRDNDQGWLAPPPP